MTSATRTPHRPQRLPLPRFSRPRTADQAWTAATVVLSLVALVLALVGAYDAGAVVGAVTVAVGGWSQMVSRTVSERFETVSATILGAVVLAACLAYGSGFSF